VFKRKENFQACEALVESYFKEMLKIGQSVRMEKEVISNTQLGFINNIIGLLKSSETKIKEDKQDFICAVINGICSNLDATGKEDTLTFIFK